MAGPSASGSLIYADNPFALADFYAEIYQLEELHRKEDMVVLKTPGGNLVIHQSPIMMSGSTRPPEE